MIEEKISKEMKRKIFELTLALYRVTDFFPQEEILKKQLRQKANDALGLIAEYSVNYESRNDIYNIIAKIKAIKSYLSLAKYNKLVKPINTAVLEREYNFFENFFERELDYFEDMAGDLLSKNSKPKKTTAIERDVIFHQKFSVENGNGASDHEHDHSYIPQQAAKKELVKSMLKISGRQEKIMAYLGRNGQVKIGDLTGIFNGISSKTIQRDLNDLVVKRVLKKEGEKRWTVYSLVS